MTDIELRKIFSNNLNHFLEMNQYTQADMARHMHVSTAATAKWCTGQSIPRIDKIQSLCNWLGIEKNDLLEARTVGRKNTPSAVRIPIYSSTAAGMPIQMNPEVEAYEYIPEEWARNGKFFGVKVKGNSMEPLIHDGDIVIARKQNDADTGDIVIVSLGNETATCKKLQKDKGGITLLPINTQDDRNKAMHFSNEEIEEHQIAVIGKVKASLTNFF